MEMRGVVWYSLADERSLGTRSKARRNVETTLTVMDDLRPLAGGIGDGLIGEVHQARTRYPQLMQIRAMIFLHSPTQHPISPVPPPVVRTP